MKSYDVDVVVIGGGSAGLAAAIVVKKADLNVLILERDKELGGITLQCIHSVGTGHWGTLHRRISGSLLWMV